jgi:ubiquinone/menaquinone biosynthesis C-methylase UbiE
LSGASDVSARFDRISGVYDETREPLAEKSVDKLAHILSRNGLKSLLEVGVGTGRIALPLQERGFLLVGADISKGMLQKARDKGLQNLFRGDANLLPFGDKSFDGVILAHIIHLLEDPTATFGGLTRVARKEIVAIVRKRDWGASPLAEGRSQIRESFRKASEELGYTLNQSAGDWRQRFRREEEFVSSFHPDELLTIDDSPVVTTVGERLSYFEKRAYGYPAEMPDDVFRRIMESVKSSLDLGREIRYQRVEQVAIWRLKDSASAVSTS